MIVSAIVPTSFDSFSAPVMSGTFAIIVFIRIDIAIVAVCSASRGGSCFCSW